MATYPFTDGTNNAERVLFPPNVDRFAEDYTQLEYLREMEDLMRFNSAVKSPGVVAKKAAQNLNLYPSITVQPNTIKITAGVGFTKNGSMIVVYNNIVIDDLTQLANWEPADANDGYLYLVLRKKAQEYSARLNRVSGESKNTRLRIQSTHNSYADTIVEWYYATQPSLITDTDIVVLGRLSAYNNSTLDTTEKTGGRVILRNDEIAPLEITGGVMEGDINMNHLYNILNVPQWGSAYWKTNGVPHNTDFVKLFSRVNATLFLNTGIKFEQVGGQYGLSFTGGTNVVKFSILPGQTPPIKLDFTNTAFLSIPENNVLYYQYTLDELGIPNEGGAEPIGGGIDDPITGGTSSGSLHTTHFYNTGNIGTSGNVARYPICIHYLIPNTSDHYLIFSNGTILKLNDSITSGQVSYYLRTDGGNNMSGNINIVKQQARLVLKDAAGGVAGDLFSGLYFQNVGGLELGAFYRIMDLQGSGNTDYPVDAEDEVGDTKVWVTSDSNGTNPKDFIFKKDGRFKIRGTPSEANDVITLGFGQGSNGFLRKIVPSGTQELGTGDYKFNGSVTIQRGTTTPYLWLGSGTNYATNKAEFWNYGDTWLIGNVVIGDPTDGDVGDEFNCRNSAVFGDPDDVDTVRTYQFLGDTWIAQLTAKKIFGVNGKSYVNATDNYYTDSRYLGLANGSQWVEGNIWSRGYEIMSAIEKLKVKTFWLT